MSGIKGIRKVVTVVDEVYTESGREVDPPTRRVVVAAVVANPYAGEYVEKLTALEDLGEQLGEELALRALRALGATGAQVQSFGKAAMVGEDGELEHAAAVLHPRLGAGLRRAIGGGKALVPSSKKRGGLGQVLDVPLGHKDAAYVRSHFDAIEVSINDAPRRDELVVAVALTDSGRPLARVGGLTVDAVVGDDGLH
jgi:hypothetical protein